MFYDEVKKSTSKCECCDQEIVHKACFRCAFCECELRLGRCAMEPYFFHRYGPLWFCDKHSKLPPGEKEAQLVQRGVKPKQKTKK